MNILLMLLSLSVTGAIMFFVVYALRPMIGKYFPQWTIYSLYLVVILRLLIPYSPEFSVMQRVYSAVSDGSSFSRDEQPETAEAAYFEPTEQPTITEDTGSGENMVTTFYDEHINKSDSTPDSPVLSENTLQPPVISTAASGEKADEHNKYLSLFTIILLTVWAAGAAALMLKTLVGYFVFLRRVKERQTIYAIPDEIALRLEKLPPVVRDSGSCSPMVIGLLRPKIILPEREYDSEKLYCVLLHECTHYRRGDIIVKWLCELACCLYWFLPVMPLLRRELSDACETACDEKAVSDMDKVQRKIYVKTLLATAVDGAAAYDSMRLAPTMTASGRRFQERLKKNMTYKRSGALRGALSILLVCAFISGGILLGGCVGGDNAAGGASSDQPEGWVELDPAEYTDWEMAIWDHYNRTSLPHKKNAKVIDLCGKKYMSDDTVVSIDLMECEGNVDLSPLREFEHIDYLLMNGHYRWNYLSPVHLTDTSPICELKDMKGFVFDGFDMTDLSFISSLDGLELLSVRNPSTDNYIDYSFVRSLGSLRELYINICDGSDLGFLEGLNQLEKLELSGEMSNVVSGGFPRGLTGLQRLYLETSDVLEDYSGLNDCVNLSSLEIDCGRLYNSAGPDFMDMSFDISFLRSMPKLKELAVTVGSSKGIENVCSIKGLETLKLMLTYPFDPEMSGEEAIKAAGSLDLSPLGGLNSLRSAVFNVPNFLWYFSDMDVQEKTAHIITEEFITSLPATVSSFACYLSIDEGNARLLGRFSEMEELDVSLPCSPGILDFLNDTTKMKKLKLSLGADELAGVDLTPVGRLSSLEDLELEKHNSLPFENTEALSHLTKLKRLYLWDDAPDAFSGGGLSFLKGMSSLEDLTLYAAHEDCDLSPISALVSLKKLFISIAYLLPEEERIAAINEGRLEKVYQSAAPRHLDLSFIGSLDRLEWLQITVDTEYDVDGFDLTPVSGKKKLKNLYLVSVSANCLPDMSKLSGCDSLEHINISYLFDDQPAVMEEAEKFTANNPGYIITDRQGELFIDRVYMAGAKSDEEDISLSGESSDAGTAVQERDPFAAAYISGGSLLSADETGSEELELFDYSIISQLYDALTPENTWTTYSDPVVLSEDVTHIRIIGQEAFGGGYDYSVGNGGDVYINRIRALPSDSPEHLFMRMPPEAYERYLALLALAAEKAHPVPRRDLTNAIDLAMTSDNTIVFTQKEPDEGGNFYIADYPFYTPEIAEFITHSFAGIDSWERIDDDRYKSIIDDSATKGEPSPYGIQISSALPIGTIMVIKRGEYCIVKYDQPTSEIYIADRDIYTPLYEILNMG